MPLGTCQLRCMHSVTLELDHKLILVIFLLGFVGVKLGPSLVKTMDVWGSGRSGPRNSS